MSRGRRAALPDWEIEPAEPSGSAASLEVTLSLEDSPNYVFDVSRMVGPEQVRAELVRAVAAWSSSENGGRRTASVLSVRRGLSAFLRWVDCWNREGGTVAGSQIQSLADMTPFHLQRYQYHLGSEHAPHTRHEYYATATILLLLAPGVAQATRREALKRKLELPPPAHSIQRYSNAAFTQIRNAARRTVEMAHTRITASYLLAQAHDDPKCPYPDRARALHEVMVHGRPQSRGGMLALGASVATADSGGGIAAARRHLFLDADEVLAAAVLLVCQRGLNLSPIVTACRPDEHEPGLLQLNLDKPRRGPTDRFWPEIFSDSEGHGGQHRDGMAAKAVRLIAESTEPAREHLLTLGRPSQRLLIYWSNNRANPRFGIPPYKTRRKAAWIPAGTTIEFPRLRRSVPGQGVAKEPTDHSPDTYLHYVRSDPDALMEQREEAALGVLKMVDQARARLAIRVEEDSDTNPSADSVLVNCSDPQQRPDTGMACTTGFYSFLDCLECGNAATVLRLLPRQLAALHVLEQLRDSLGETWERRFAARYYTLVAIVDRHTLAEREFAASGVQQHIPTIISALRHEVPHEHPTS